MVLHQIDKGLAMHDMRLGFGQEKIVSLNETIDSYICKYGDEDTQLLDAIAVLFLYDDVHKKAVSNCLRIFRKLSR